MPETSLPPPPPPLSPSSGPLSALARAAAQFRDLDPTDPGLWPPLPRLALGALVALGVLALAWVLLLSDTRAGLEAAREREPALQQEIRGKLARTAQLGALQAQRAQLQQLVAQLDRELPERAQLDALLPTLHQTALAQRLQVELFRPEPPQARPHVVEQPIALRVSGPYHALGAFAAEVARLPHLVTLQELRLAAGPREGALTLEATARAYRRPDAAESTPPKTAAAGAGSAS